MPTALPLRTYMILAGLMAVGTAAGAQARMTVDPKLSLAWWQISPHLNHLWATTCPEEPSWRPGEGRSSGWVINEELRSVYDGHTTGDQNVEDTIHVPLYPRGVVQVECTPAVSGQVSVGDTAVWRGVRGLVAVRGAHLISGENRRDAYAREAVLQTARFPDIRFVIDSLVNVREAGDTLVGTAVGEFTLRGVTKPMTALVRSWPEAGGRRVLARIRIPVRHLTTVYGMSKFALGLGVGTELWKDVFFGVDVLLRPEASGGE